MQHMRRQVMEHNVYRWAATLLGDLRELRIENPGGADVSHPGPVAVPSPTDTARRSA
jgi:trehalose 6-phosphate synthase